MQYSLKITQSQDPGAREIGWYPSFPRRPTFDKCLEVATAWAKSFRPRASAEGDIKWKPQSIQYLQIWSYIYGNVYLCTYVYIIIYIYTYICICTYTQYSGICKICGTETLDTIYQSRLCASSFWSAAFCVFSRVWIDSNVIQ